MSIDLGPIAMQKKCFSKKGLCLKTILYSKGTSTIEGNIVEHSRIILYQKKQVQNKVFLIRNSIPARKKKLMIKWNVSH